MKLFKLKIALGIMVPVNLAAFAFCMLINSGAIVTSFICALTFAISSYIAINISNKQTRTKRLEFIKYYKFPEIVCKKFMAEHKYLSNSQADEVATALKQFFMAFALTKDGGKKPTEGLSMPSRITDELWHHFILDSANYEKFCKQAFGTMFHHKPGMDTEGNHAVYLMNSFPKDLTDTYSYIESLKHYIGLDTIKGIPTLFAIDAHLKIDNGFYYDSKAVDKIEKTINKVSIAKKEKEKAKEVASSCGGFYSCGGTSSLPSTNSLSPSPVTASAVASCGSVSSKSDSISGGGNYSGGGSSVSSCSSKSSDSSSSSSSSCGSSCGGGGGGD